MTTTDVYRDGKVHVCRTMCATCIGRPGNLMRLAPGRVEQMVDECGEWGCIPCHSTIHRGGDEAVCRWFFDRQNTAMQMAARLGVVEFVTFTEADD